ncbi:MAG: hypothetical protein IT303_04390 [Dehalococcoidia bacterium]|nr:hypothetical protein [Dehalococcoidia bacterium]
MKQESIEGRLTAREVEVIRLMARGYTNSRIAGELGISFATAKTHVSDIIGRLGVTTREEAVAAWRAEHAAPARLRAGVASLLGWKFLAAGGVAAAAVVLVAAVAFVLLRPGDAANPNELVIPLADLADGRPHSYDVGVLGQDQLGQDYLVWAVRLDTGEYRAYVGRDPHSGCLVPWQADYVFSGGMTEAAPWQTPTTVIPSFSGNGEPQPIPAVELPAFTGAFKAYCTGWVFTRAGEKVFGAADRGLDGFPVRIDGDDLVVSLDTFIAGECTSGASTNCSIPGQPPLISASLPPPRMAGFCAQRQAERAAAGVTHYDGWC